jgi:DNA-binding XRE family transcriptional regulator
MEKVLNLKRSKREELIHNKLCNNLAQHLDIPISEVFSPDLLW